MPTVPAAVARQQRPAAAAVPPDPKSVKSVGPQLRLNSLTRNSSYVQVPGRLRPAGPKAQRLHASTPDPAAMLLTPLARRVSKSLVCQVPCSTVTPCGHGCVAGPAVSWGRSLPVNLPVPATRGLAPGPGYCTSLSPSPSRAASDAESPMNPGSASAAPEDSKRDICLSARLTDHKIIEGLGQSVLGDHRAACGPGRGK